MFLLRLQQFGTILDVEIIFNERGSKVSFVAAPPPLSPLFISLTHLFALTLCIILRLLCCTIHLNYAHSQGTCEARST